MEWFQVITLIGALLAAVGALGAAIAAILSYKEARKQRMDAETPVISFRFREAKVEPTDPIYDTEFERFKKKDKSGLTKGEPLPVFSYRLVNVGAGPAMKVSFEQINIEGTTEIDNIIGAKVPPELEVCFATSPRNDTNYLRKDDTRLTVKYEDIFKRKYKTEFIEKKNNFRSIKEERTYLSNFWTFMRSLLFCRKKRL